MNVTTTMRPNEARRHQNCCTSAVPSRCKHGAGAELLTKQLRAGAIDALQNNETFPNQQTRNVTTGTACSQSRRGGCLSGAQMDQSLLCVLK